MLQCDFTTRHYREILRKIKHAGFAFTNYEQYVKMSASHADRVFILRHDLDHSLVYANKLAEIEAEESVTATFFVWLSAPYYNVIHPEQIKLIRRIIDLGHSIGLHFDPTAYPESKDLSMMIQREIGILSTIIDHTVSAYSFHRPTAAMLNQHWKIDGLINSYDRILFGDFKYLSDSNHQWREGCVCRHLADHNKLHALIHPIWWCFDNCDTPIEKLHQARKDLDDHVSHELMRNVKVFREYYGS
ncbi:hypothetical protein [Paenibacillus xerothermodurans]|uniref:Polysaccharide deacetylase n=1 Tax=Paenibacillus xerothermodurans TaxID=1977292 RepID=A0A2W1NB72_PAEXE|nr:hypothetical protein [Paenibacillus xerothermodurans]PZE21134.1 hypothetical protein CBW46_010685 [Paenibacillus xerothermodurans]